MKPVAKDSSTAQSQKILTALILTGVMSVGSGLTLIKSSAAADKIPLPEVAQESVKPNATSDRLPSQVADAVLRNASEVSGLPKKTLNILTFIRTQWTSGCENPIFPRPCDPAVVRGWEVIVGAGDNRWIYSTDENGSQVKLSEKGTQATLPKSIIGKILVDASKWSGLSTEALRIVKIESQTWANPCMFGFRQICTREYNPVAGWEVTVDSGTQNWMYRVDDKATSVLLDRTPSLTPKAAEVIKKDAAKFLASPNLRIIAVERRDDWNGICEGVPNCTRPIASGWQATVSNGRDSYVYRVKEDGSQFEMQSQNGNNQILKPVPIPGNELPSPWGRNVVFREIYYTGGVIGRTFETVLFTNGRLISTLVGDAPDSGRSVGHLSRQQVRQFQQLLERQGFAQFKNLNYQSKTAHYNMSIRALTSRDGTVRYTSINGLPANLRAVVEAWNQLLGSAQERNR